MKDRKQINTKPGKGRKYKNLGKTENKLTQNLGKAEKPKSNNLHNLLYTSGKARINVDLKIIKLVIKNTSAFVHVEN